LGDCAIKEHEVSSLPRHGNLPRQFMAEDLNAGIGDYASLERKSAV
jgi:hypothetical protein